MTSKHPPIYTLVLTAVFFLACLYFTLNLNLNEKVTALLPDSDPDVIDFNYVISQVPAAQNLYIQVETKENDPAALVKAGDAFFAAMEVSPYFTDIIYQFSQASVIDLMEFIHQNKYWLFDDRDLTEIQRRFTPENINLLLPDIKRKLLDPAAMFATKSLTRDPFGLDSIILKRLTAFQTEASGIKVSGSRIISQDGKSLLIMASPAFPAVDTRQSRKMIEFLNLEKSKLILTHGQNIMVGISGAHVATLDNSTTIQADVKRAILVMTLGILIMGLLFFGRFYHVLLIFLPTLVSLTFASAAISFFTHQVSAIALGCGAVLMGITVDFGIHILFHVDTRGPEHTQTIIDQLKHPIATGAATTMAAFGCLLFSSLPGQRQMGWFALVGIFSAAVFAVFILKPFITIWARPPKKPLISLTNFSQNLVAFRKKHLHFLFFFCLILLGTSFFGLGSFRFEGDVSALNHLTPQTQKDMDKFLATWGQESPSIFLVQAPSLDQALEKNDQLFSRLKQMEDKGDLKGIASLSEIFPSVAQREKQFRAFQDAFPLGWIKTLEQTMTQACETHGFTQDAFAPFFTSLKKIYTQKGLPPYGLEDFTPTVISPLIKSKLIFTKVQPGKLTGGQPKTVLILTTAQIKDKTKIAGITAQVKRAVPGTLFLDKQNFIKKITTLVAKEFKLFFVGAGLSMMAMLFLFQRRLKVVLITMTPVCLSAIITAGLLGLAGIPINLISIVFIIFVFGVGVDFSIFLVHHEMNKAREDEAVTSGAVTTGAVIICAMTTTGAFACLAFARHQALFSIGAAGLLGMLVSLILALVIIPFLTEHWILKQ